MSRAVELGASAKVQLCLRLERGGCTVAAGFNFNETGGGDDPARVVDCQVADCCDGGCGIVGAGVGVGVDGDGGVGGGGIYVGDGGFVLLCVAWVVEGEGCEEGRR